MSEYHEDTPEGEVRDSSGPPEEQEAPPGAEPRVARKGMRRWIGVIVAVAIVLIAAAAFFLRPQPVRELRGSVIQRLLPRPNPRGILEKMLAAYQGSKTFQAEGRFAYDIQMNGTRSQTEMPFKMAYQAPNRMYLQVGQGIQQSKTVCDGQNVYVEIPFLHRVVKMPAPATAKELAACPIGPSGPEASGLLDLKQLVGGEFQLDQVESIQEGFDEKNAWLASLKQPEDTWALTVTTKKGPSTVLWVGRRDHLLRQAAVEMNMADVMAAPAAGQPSGALPREEEGAERRGSAAPAFGGSPARGAAPSSQGKAPAHGPESEMARQMMEAFKNMTMKIAIIYDQASAGGSIPEDTFAYSPPEGAKIIEVKSAEDMPRVLMDEMRGMGAELSEGIKTWEEMLPPAQAPEKSGAH